MELGGMFIKNIKNRESLQTNLLSKSCVVDDLYRLKIVDS